jgi:hypothetical protein
MSNTNWHEWKSMVAYKCPLCHKYYAKPWSHLCKRDTSLIQCGLCKHHYIDTITRGYGWDEPPEYEGRCHACRKGHGNNTPRMRECKDYEKEIEIAWDENNEEESLKKIEEQEKRWKL